MAFILQNFENMTVANNSTPRVFSYNGGADSEVAIVQTDGYFDDVLDVLNLGDLIYIKSSDAEFWYSVVNVTPPSTVARVSTVRFADVSVFTGGATTQAFPVFGLLATDIVIATPKTQTNDAIVSAVPSAGILTLNFSVDPGASEHYYAVFSPKQFL